MTEDTMGYRRFLLTVTVFALLVGLLGVVRHREIQKRADFFELEARYIRSEALVRQLTDEKALLVSDLEGLRGAYRNLLAYKQTERIVPCDVGHDTPIFAPEWTYP